MYNPSFSSIKKLFNFLLIVNLAILLVSCGGSNPIKQNKVEVAILMPLSGTHESQGIKLAEFVKWGIEDHLNGFVSTTTYDVATEDLTQQAIKKIISKNTKIILGPIFSPTVRYLETTVKERDIIMLTLSNNHLLAEENSIFIFGHAPLKQTNRMLNYLLTKGHKDFAILAPAGKAGQNLTKTLSEIIASNNASMVISEYYDSRPQSIEDAILKISNKADDIMEDIDNEFKPVVILVEESQSNLKEIFLQLKKYNLDEKSVIVGDSRIDNEENMHYLFTGANIENNIVGKKAKAELGIERMNFLENLAYDLGSLASLAIGEDFTKETFFNRLKSPVWHHGLSGDVRFSGPIAERKYSIIEKDNNSYKIIDKPL